MGGFLNKLAYENNKLFRLLRSYFWTMHFMQGGENDGFEEDSDEEKKDGLAMGDSQDDLWHLRIVAGVDLENYVLR